MSNKELEFQASELPGGNDPIFIRHAKKGLERIEHLESVKPEEYILDNYQIKVKKEDDIIEIQITGIGSDGGKRGIAFQINNDVKQGMVAQHIKDCFRALFRHETQKVLNGKNEAT